MAGGSMTNLIQTFSERTDQSDASLAVMLAHSAGSLLLKLQAEHIHGDPGALATLGDRRSQQFLSRALQAMRPQDYLLSEEAADNTGRLDASRVWIVDPLDGSKEFSQGRGDWAVHVALWESGRLAAGAVAIPQLNLVYSTESGSSNVATHNKLRMAVSRTRAPEIAARVATTLDASLCPMGSAGYKACAVISGEMDLYLHAGGQYEWDSAAPVAVAMAAGLHASRLDGSPLVYNQADPYLPDLLICRQELRDAALSAIAENSPGSALRVGDSHA